MKSLNLIFHTDPGHGWLEVPKSLISELGIENQITPCSYMDDENGYLEEDCDAAVFADAAKSQGYELTFAEHFKEHTPIRNLRSFSVN